MDENILDLPAGSEKSAPQKYSNRKYLIRIAILMIINTAAFSLLPMDNRSAYERFLVAWKTFLIGIPFLGFVLGLIVAIIPYKGLGYDKKYLRSSLLTIYVLHFLIVILMLMNVILIIWNALENRT